MRSRRSVLAGLLSTLLIPRATEVLEVRASSPSLDGASELNGTSLDIHTLSNPHQVRVQRLEIDLTVDFQTKQLLGTACLNFQRMPGCPRKTPLVLDSRDLAIE